MRKSKEKERLIHEWRRGYIANIGVTSTFPYEPIFHYIKDKILFDIVNLFFENKTEKVSYLDQCILEQFWWINSEIISARYCKIEHPNHYSGEYIFDKKNGERTIIEIRQPDMDGKHWRAKHIHIKRGQIDPSVNFRIIKPTFNEHIELYGENLVNAVYVMKIFEP